MVDGDGEALRELQRRGAALWTAVSRLPSHALTADCRARLLKAVQAERNFVDRLAAQDGSAVADAHLSRWVPLEISPDFPPFEIFQ
jgi:hypothetical protein